MPFFFFDGHGALWANCEPAHPRAEAFGPRGSARQASPAEAGLSLLPGETAYTAAERMGLLVRSDPDDSATVNHVRAAPDLGRAAK